MEFMNLIIILLFFQEGKSFMGDSSSSHYYCTDMWRNLIGSASGRGCHFVFGLHPIYIYICLSSSSLLISSLIQRENLLLQEPCSCRLSTLFTRSLRPSLLLETICLVSLLSFSSINFLYFS